MIKASSSFYHRFQKELCVAMRATDMARKIALKYWRTNLETHTKSSPRDLVTKADLEIDHAIQKMVKRSFPHQQILSEELAPQCNLEQTDYLWVIDPIDGTVNFTMGEPIFGVSIGLLYRGQPILGVIDMPALDERYWAVSGSGALLKWRRERPRRCRVSTTATLRQGRFSFGYNENARAQQRYTDLLPRIITKTLAIRDNHAAVFDLMNVVRGGMDFYLCLDINLWDMAAAWCILNEAGGEIVNLKRLSVKYKKNPFTVNGNDIIATNKKLTNKIIPLFK